MEEKLSFSVENVEVVEENPNSNFAVLNLDFFASGDNLHNLYVSEETLLKTAHTIKNCPLVWKYDERLDDIYTHDKDEVPCGFVPETAEINSRKLSDGRTMLSVMAYVWKRYTGDLLKIFKRDAGRKPVSVEMRVYDIRDIDEEKMELLDYRYEGITLLGSFVTPAIPLANASVLSFSDLKKQYVDDLRQEFPVDTSIPENVKDAVKKLLEYSKENKVQFSSMGKSIAHYLVRNKKISQEQLGNVIRFFSNCKENEDIIAQKENEILEWASNLSEKIENKLLVTSPYKSVGGINPAKQTLFAEDEHLVKESEISGLDTPRKEDIFMEEEVKVEMAKTEQEIEKTEEEKESPEEEAKEEKKFEFPGNFNFEAMGEIFSEDEEEEIKTAKEEAGKGQFANPSVIMSGMFAKMCKMAKVITEMAENAKVYMSENEELKKFKADVEKSQKAFAVQKTLEELSEKVVIPDEAREEMVLASENYSYENLETWKMYCKAKSFEFTAKKSSDDEVTKIGLPFTATTPKSKNDLWA